MVPHGIKTAMAETCFAGIEGNQPAISAFCETSKEEDEKIADAIVRQKVGANPRTIKAHAETTKARKEATEGQ